MNVAVKSWLKVWVATVLGMFLADGADVFAVDKGDVRLYLAAGANGVQSYSRANLATDGAIAITKFGLGEEGYATGLLVGLQTNGVATDCVVSSNQTAASHLLIAAMQTSQLVFDPQTSAVSIEA